MIQSSVNFYFNQKEQNIFNKNIICYIFLYVCISNNDVRSIMNRKYFLNPIKEALLTICQIDRIFSFYTIKFINRSRKHKNKINE
jgi:hypothetical protein